jgi:hypothetical protein
MAFGTIFANYLTLIHSEYINPWDRFFHFLGIGTAGDHHVHHAKFVYNYGHLFTYWDRLFGTFAAEEAGEPCRYGVVRNLTTFNPFVIAFHEWRSLFRDLARARSPRAALGAIWGPPGWKADGSGMTSDSLRRAHAEALGVNPAGS